MQKFRNLAIGLIIALGLSVLMPAASWADPPRGSGYPFTQIVEGSLAKEQCPVGFQHANGLIVDVSTGIRYTECWPEAAFIANRIGGSTWQAFKDSGGTLSVDELYAIQQAWRDYYQEIEDAQDAAAEESRRWNEAHPGQQKCVQWGPIVAPDGVGQSSGGVCANPVSAPAEPSASPTVSPEVTEDSSASSEATSSPTPEPEPEPEPAPEPAPAPTGTTGSSADSDESTGAENDQTATQSPSAPAKDEKVAIATPTNLKVTSDENAVYLTVENGKNKKVSVKFAGKWSVFTPTSDVVTEAFYPGTAGFVSMAVYVDGVIKLNTFVQRTSAAAPDTAQNEQAAAPDGAKGNGYPFTRMVIGQVGVAGCPSGFNYATGLIVDVGANRTYTECWPEAAFIANRLGGDVWQAFKASNGATSVESLRRAWADRNGTGSNVDSAPTSSEVVEAGPTESQKVTVSPSVALKTTENSVRVEVSNGIGSRLSAKIAGNWYVVEIDKALEIIEKQVQPGVEVRVAIYIDRALILLQSVTAGTAEAATEVPLETEQSPADSNSTSSQSQSTSSTAPASISAPVSVEVGSNGSDIAFSVLNGQGKKISVKVGGRWIVQVPTSQNYVFTASSIQGQDVEIRIYVEGELTGASTITVGDPTQTSFVQEVSTESPSSGASSDNTSSPVTEATTSPALNFEAAVTSSNSEIVVSLSGAEGQKVSLKVGGRWFVVYPSTSQEEFRTTSIAGETVAIDVYVNAVFWGSLTTIVQD